MASLTAVLQLRPSQAPGKRKSPASTPQQHTSQQRQPQQAQPALQHHGCTSAATAAAVAAAPAAAVAPPVQLLTPELQALLAAIPTPAFPISPALQGATAQPSFLPNMPMLPELGSPFYRNLLPQQAQQAAAPAAIAPPPHPSSEHAQLLEQLFPASVNLSTPLESMLQPLEQLRQALQQITGDLLQGFCLCGPRPPHKSKAVVGKAWIAHCAVAPSK